MPENPMNLTASEEKNILGPDYFGFYTNELKRLLSQDDVLLPYSPQVSSSAGNLIGVGRQKGSTKYSCQTKKNNGTIGSASLFSNKVGVMLSEFKKKRLKSLLRQSVLTLTKEVDEMINPVFNVCRIRTCLRSKESLLKSDATTCKADTLKQPDCSSLYKAQNAKNVEENAVLDDDLRFILENDSIKVGELMKSHTSEISAMLHDMEQNMEEILNIVVTTCRAMTIAEKHQLCKSIQNLPQNNLDRVAEIIELNKPTEQNSSSELRVDLDTLDNVTLWRLYFYVAIVKDTSSK